ncbi:MAG: hypothetical protein ABSH13_24700 [Candidatus Acidiferrum sp.]
MISHSLTSYFVGQLREPVPIRENGLRHLELVALTIGQIVTGLALFHHPQNLPGHYLHFSGLAIHIVEVLVGKILQRVHYVFQQHLHPLAPDVGHVRRVSPPSSATGPKRR